jgi:hypothetical protein
MTSAAGASAPARATMDPGPPGAAREEVVVPASAKAMTVLTVLGLVAATGYTVALGADGWLWLAWAVLGLSTIGVLAAGR